MKTDPYFEKQATLHSATCFLNSLLRESKHHQFSDSPSFPQITVPIHANAAVILPLRKHSELGRHQYTGTFYLEINQDRTEISFSRLVELLTDFFRAELSADPVSIKQFRSRVFTSLNTIQKALISRGPSTSSSSLHFKDTEQALLIGHNFHPTPKSRDEFDEKDLLNYSPEFAGKLRLDWLMAEPSILYQKKSACFEDREWTEALAREDLADTALLDKYLSIGFTPMPMHPWQLKVLQKNPAIKAHFDTGRLVVIGTSKSDWYPTSSLRSLYNPSAEFMLKFSMSVKLTNSIRHLLPREVDRGLQLADVLATPKGKRFLAENPQFHIITEPASLSLRDLEGNELPETLVVCRLNPFDSVGAQGKAMLATLTQDAVLGGTPLLQALLRTDLQTSSPSEKTKKWFEAYLRTTVKPLLLAQANYGIILGAHQQNLVLHIEDGYPTEAYFRDCQSAGYTERGFENFAPDVSSIHRENGNIVDEKMGSCLFIYYVVLNSTFNVITALTRDESVSESELLADLRLFLSKILDEGVHDDTYIKALLEQPTLMHKGNFFCSFKNMNENTAHNPLSIYVPVENPLQGAAL